MIARLVPALLSLFAAVPAAAQDRIWGSGDGWQVRLSNAGCEFIYAPDGAAGTEVAISPGDRTSFVAIYSPALPGRSPSNANDSVSISGNAGWRSTAENGRGGVFARVEDLNTLLANTPIRVSPAASDGPDLDVALPAMALPQSDYASCAIENDHRQRGSNQRAVVQSHLRQPVSIFILPDDYPAWAWRQQIGGRIRIRLTISVFARPLGCAIMESTGNAQLDAFSCNIFKRRARFTIASDAEGRPTVGSVDIVHDWVPPPPPPPIHIESSPVF